MTGLIVLVIGWAFILYGAWRIQRYRLAERAFIHDQKMKKVREQLGMLNENPLDFVNNRPISIGFAKKTRRPA